MIRRCGEHVMDDLVIGICDDQKEIIIDLKKLIEAYLSAQNCSFELYMFVNGEDLLGQIDKINVVFLDIEMPGMDGIELGKKIKQINPECRIIMATGRVDRFKDAFRIHAERFITKPFDRTEVEEALCAVVEQNLGEKTIELYFMRNLYKICQHDIWYIIAYNGYTEFVVGDKVFRKEASLNEVEGILDERIFFRISRKYMINMQWIQSYSEGTIRIEGKGFEVSRRKRKDFEQKYIEFDLRYR